MKIFAHRDKGKAYLITDKSHLQASSWNNSDGNPVDNTEMVSYISLDSGMLFTRPSAEFKERFRTISATEAGKVVNSNETLVNFGSTKAFCNMLFNELIYANLVKGRHSWWKSSVLDDYALKRMFYNAVIKGNPITIGIYAMMLYYRGITLTDGDRTEHLHYIEKARGLRP